MQGGIQGMQEACASDLAATNLEMGKALRPAQPFRGIRNGQPDNFRSTQCISLEGKK